MRSVSSSLTTLLAILSGTDNHPMQSSNDIVIGGRAAGWTKTCGSPVGYLHRIDNPRADRRFCTEPEARLNGRSLMYPPGKVLGGGGNCM